MTDQILTGTNPAADARLIADVMAAKTETNLTLRWNTAFAGYDLCYIVLDREYRVLEAKSEEARDAWHATVLKHGIKSVEATKAWEASISASAACMALARAMVAMTQQFANARRTAGYAG
jgi:hypothetical protein